MSNILGFWKHSLLARITGLIFLLAVLTVPLVSYVVYAQAERGLTRSIFDRLNAVLTLKEDSLNRWIDQQRLDLVFLAWQPDVRAQAGILLGNTAPEVGAAAAREILKGYLQFVITSVSDSTELFILDMDGKVVVSTLAGREGQSHAEALFFTQGQSSTYVQPVYTSEESGRPTITVATPLFDQAKRRVGVLVSHLNLARLDRIILERSGLGETGETYLVDLNHSFVSAAQTMNQAAPAGLRSDGIDSALRGVPGQGGYDNYRGVPVLGVYKWMDLSGMALIAEISQQEAFEPARQLALSTTLYGLLASLLLAGGAYWLARRITAPVLALTRTARLVAAGDLSQNAPVTTQDEVGALARTFNEMTAQLRLLYQDLEKEVEERTAELVHVNQRLSDEIVVREALHETSLGLISRLELQELFEDLVTRAGQLVGTPHGFVYIAEPEARAIECKVGIGLFANLVGVAMHRGEGLGGTVWETGRPLIIDNYDRWPGRGKKIAEGLIGSIIGVPLTSGNQVMGVLGLAFSCAELGTRTFDQQQVEHLNRFAHLASIALDNARLYTAAKEARAAAEAANQAKSIFLANVSHELRTPLTSIVGFAHILKKRFQEHIYPHLPLEDVKAQRVSRQANENLDIILAEGRRLTDLINNLLDLEKIQAGKMTWRMQPLQVRDLIRLASAATASLFEEKGLEWVEEIEENLPDVSGDRDRLEQVLINLISNAVKFSDAGPIRCRAYREDGDVVICVQDRGIGIAPSDHDAVFEQFKQVGDTLTGKPKGTGLGLPICKEIVSYHGGKMWLESALGQGSTFYFSLPVVNEGTRREPDQPAGQQVEQSGSWVI